MIIAPRGPREWATWPAEVRRIERRIEQLELAAGDIRCGEARRADYLQRVRQLTGALEAIKQATMVGEVAPYTTNRRARTRPHP